MRLLKGVVVLAFHCTVLAPATFAQNAPAANGVLFENVRVFDGRSPALSQPANLLVVGNTIQVISAAPIPLPANVTVQRIDGKGRTLMPGLIDNHWHTMLARPTPAELLDADIGYINLLAGAEATATLMRGFTTVRDMGGPSFGLKRAIDEGLVAGPRIYPSGAMITITGGHGDFRSRGDLPRQLGGPLSRMEMVGGSMVADSPDEVRVRAREQLSLGASQVKLTAGGGVASPHSPLDVATFNEDELRAAVQAAENWGTYVATHAYTPIAIQRSIKAGVKVIEHGHLMDEPTARMMADNGIWLSFQPFTDDGHVPQLPRRTCADCSRCSPAPSEPWRWRRNTSSRRRSAPTSCFPPRARRARASCSRAWGSGTRRSRSCRWRPRPMPSFSSSPDPATPTPAGLAWWRKARWPISSS